MKPMIKNIVDKEFVPVYETNTGEKVVIARELYESLLVSTRFNDWIQRNLLTVGFVENKDFYSFSSKTSGRPAQDYILTLDTAKHIAMIQRTEQGMKIRQKFIDLEKSVQSMAQMTPAELALLQAQNIVALERRLNEQDHRIEKIEIEQKNMADIINLNIIEWRKKVNALLNRIANRLGGDGQFQAIRNESYQTLEDRARCNLSIRVENKKKNLLASGSSKTKVNNVSKLDVISEDTRLTEIYLAIVKEMAIKYRVNVSDLAI